MNATQQVLDLFEQLSAIPRGSGREAKLSRWLQERAEAHGFLWRADSARNLLIRVPATAGYENAPVVVLQGHMDMVCEKTPESTHDFTLDPIRCLVEGDWLHADGTTLGADNGIAIALALALAEDPSVAHPPLELLFTVEEEVGLGGANLLQPGFIKGKILLNLDSEEEGTFIVGCAGGQSTRMRLPSHQQAPALGPAFHLKVSGLQGGHSGVDIHKHRASANKLIARTLAEIRKVASIGLMSLDGGTAHNAISRGAEASFTCSVEEIPAIQQAVRDFEQVLNNEFSVAEHGILLTLTPADVGPAATGADTDKILRLLMALPHGVAEMSASVEGFVETSNNLARIELAEGALKVVTSQRSNVMTRMAELTARITAIGELAGAEVTSTEAYPGWQPEMKSPLLQRSVETYQRLFGVAPQVQIMHAGLECGTIGAIFGGMDMISLGATIENPHSPGERLHIPSVGKVWEYLVEFLKAG
jgi:dipeptidase D